MQPLVSNLDLRFGYPLTKTYQVFHDERLRRWREDFQLALIYGPGDAVRALDGSTWLCLTRVQSVDPRTEGQTQWVTLSPPSIAGYTSRATFAGVGAWPGLTLEMAVLAGEAKTVLTVAATDFQNAPPNSSSHWYAELTDVLGKKTLHVEGTAKYRAP